MSNIRFHKLLFEDAAKILNVQKAKDWYKVTRSQLLKTNGSIRTILIKHYDDSHTRAITEIFKENDWKPWLFPAVPKGYWDVHQNRRDFFDWFAQQNKLQTWEDWYQVTALDLKKFGGGTIVTFYNGPINAIMNAYPEYNWKVWKFNAVPSSFWMEKSNQRAYFDQISEDIGIILPKSSSLDDKRRFEESWYKISIDDVKKRGGSGVLLRNDGSLFKTLRSVYPDHNWLIWRFIDPVPLDFWKNRSNQLEFFEELYKYLNFQKMEDWYTVKKKDVDDFGGAWVASNFGSIRKTLSILYPTFDWKPYKFLFTSKGFYDDLNNAKSLLEELAKELNIMKWEDWYQVTYAQLNGSKLGAKCISMMNRYGGLITLLSKVYPQYSWESKPFNSSVYKTQNHLFRCVQELFPERDVHTEYFHPNLKFKSSNALMQLDVFVPSLSLAFEYQGERHFEQSSQDFISSEELTKNKEKDEEKRLACEREDISLITVPFWWNHSREALQATIYRSRPDIIENSSFVQPIPSKLPEKTRFYNIQDEKPDINRKITPRSTQSSGFFINFGTKYGNPPKCKSCSKVISDPFDLRVQMPVSERSYSIASVCLNYNCLHDIVSPSPSKKRSFNGKIGIPDKLKGWVDAKKLPIVEGVEWIYLERDDSEDLLMTTQNERTFQESSAEIKIPWKL